MRRAETNLIDSASETTKLTRHAEPAKLTDVGGTLYGRNTELAALDSLLTDLESGEARGVTIVGESGIGKSALLSWTIDAATQRGITVCGARARSDHQSAPLSLVRQLPQLVNLPNVAQTATVRISRVASGGFAQADQIVDRLIGVATTPTLLWFDDLQWADEPSLRVLRLLSERLDEAPIAVLLSSRPSSALGDLIDQLTILRPKTLTPDECERLFADRVGDKVIDSTATLVSHCDGIPLLVEALADRFRSDSNAEITGAVDLSALPQDSLEILRGASVFGLSFDIPDVAELLGAPVSAVVSALSHASSLGAVTLDGERPRFRHDMFRDAAYESIPTALRSTWHRQVAQILDRNGRPVGEIAGHYMLGAIPGDVDAIACLHRAANEIAATAPANACLLYDAAVALVGRGEPSAELLIDRLQAEAWAGDVDAARAMGEALLSRDLSPEARYRIHHELAFAWFSAAEPTRTIEHLVAAADAAPTPELAARTVAEVGIAQATSFDLPGSLHSAKTALAMPGGTDVPTQIIAMIVAAWNELHSFRLDAATEHAREYIHLASSPLGGDAHAYQPWFWAAMVALEHDDTAWCHELLAWGRDRTLSMGTAWSLPLIDVIGGAIAFRENRLDDARAYFEGGLATHEEVQDLGSYTYCHGMLARLDLIEGSANDALKHIEAAEAELAESMMARLGPEYTVLARSELAMSEGRAHEAFELLHNGWELAETFGFGSQSFGLAPDLVRAALAANKRSVAETVTELTTTRAALVGTHWTNGVATWCRGMLQNNSELLQDASKLLRENGRPYHANCALAEISDASHALKTPRELKPTYGWDALTATEALVADEVKLGRSNAEIAEVLCVSRRTIESHVSSILRKVGARRRAELIVMAQMAKN